MDKPGGEPLVRAIGFRGLTLSTLNLIAGASVTIAWPRPPVGGCRANALSIPPEAR